MPMLEENTTNPLPAEYRPDAVTALIEARDAKDRAEAATVPEVADDPQTVVTPATSAARDEHGRFLSRDQLRQVTGVGPKTFEQAAGFLRIRGGLNPLDSTAVHPESYKVVEEIARQASSPIDEIIRNPALLDKVNKAQLGAGAYTLADILEELKKPGRDPRDKFVAPSFLESVHGIEDLEIGMVLEGVVTNVTRFGCFVDVGVHQDGLVHISELSHKFLKDPSEAVKAGQIVKVKVLSVEARARRIALSIKALTEGPSRPVNPRPANAGPANAGPANAGQGGGKPYAGNNPRPGQPVRSGQSASPNRPPQPKTPPAQSMEDKLAALSAKFGRR